MDDTIVYLIRHAETVDENGIRTTNEDSQMINEKEILSVEGEEQAKKLSENTELKNSIDELSYENRELRRDMNKLKKFFGKDTIENALTFKIVKSKRKEIHK